MNGSSQDPFALQAHLNQQTASMWPSFEPHRRKIATLLSEAGDVDTLAILGAGNCNDIDLTALASRHGEIHLIDLDRSAIARGLERQSEEVRAKVVVHAPVDVAGILPVFAGWRGRGPSSDELDAAVVAAAQCTVPLPGNVGAIVSSCLLSQLIMTSARAIGETHPRCLDLVRAVRDGHLRLMARSLRPGGVGILVSDMVSSDTYAPLRGTEPVSLATARALVQSGNFFSGANPFLIEARLKTDPELAPYVEDVRLHEPWKWQISRDRSYLVFAISFRRSRV